MIKKERILAKLQIRLRWTLQKFTEIQYSLSVRLTDLESDMKFTIFIDTATRNCVKKQLPFSKSREVVSNGRKIATYSRGRR